MKKVISCMILIFSCNIIVFSQQLDSLRWSVGYGTLYGGGLDISYTQPIWKLWKKLNPPFWKR